MALEEWWCLDCFQIGALSKHGKCSTCGSSAVAESEGRGRWELAYTKTKRMDATSVHLLPRLMGMTIQKRVTAAQNVRMNAQWMFKK